MASIVSSFKLKITFELIDAAVIAKPTSISGMIPENRLNVLATFDELKTSEL